ncbi:MAG: hypothetical protein V3S20_03535, partial [Dehalococcoidia bacterium]
EVRWREGDSARLRYNLAQAVCDALQAKIAKLRPRPKFLTDRGDWKQRKRAEAMEQTVDGEFYRSEVDDLGPDMFADSAIVGTGFLRVLRDGRGYPLIERGFPLEFLVDHRDGFHGKPRRLYQVRPVDREVLLARVGDDNTKLRRAIVQAPEVTKSSNPFVMREADSDQILVAEAWNLPTRPDAGDGLYLCAIQGEEIDSEAWERDSFPFAIGRWQKRQYGFWGRGAVEEVKPMQIELNHTLEKIQHILHNVSTVRFWVQQGGKIKLKAQKMSNTPGEVLEYFGANPPITDVVNAVPRELFEQVDRLIAKGHAQVGLSEMAATGTKPAGLNSGEAIRTFQDVSTERFILKGRDYEQVHMHLAKRLIETKRDIALDPDEEEKPVRVPIRSGRGETVKTIKWGSAELEEEEYIMKVLPQSALPGTPTGRVATVEGWIAAGLITPEEGKGLLDFPDLKEHESLEQATKDAILSAIQVMIDEGEYVTPEPMMDLQMAMPLVSSAYNRFRWEGAPEENLELLTRFNDDIIAMMEDAAQQAAAPAGDLQQPQAPQVGAALPQGAQQAPDLAAA